MFKKVLVFVAALGIWTTVNLVGGVFQIVEKVGKAYDKIDMRKKETSSNSTLKMRKS